MFVGYENGPPFQLSMVDRKDVLVARALPKRTNLAARGCGCMKYSRFEPDGSDEIGLSLAMATS